MHILNIVHFRLKLRQVVRVDRDLFQKVILVWQLLIQIIKCLVSKSCIVCESFATCSRDVDACLHPVERCFGFSIFGFALVHLLLHSLEQHSLPA